VPENKGKSKGGLGKGLGSLIASSDAESGVNIDFTEIPINKINPNPNQPRIDFSEEKLTELMSSIQKDGLLQPIIVRPEGSGYQIVAGERRWQACRKLDFTTIAAKIVVVSDVEAQEIALVENLQRDNLNAIEEARGYQRLIEISGRKQREIAESVSKNQATISNALRLLNLPDDVQDMMFDGKLSAGHGRAILSVPDDEGRIRLATKVVDEALSVRDTETIARLYGTQGLKRAKRAPLPHSYKMVARKLRKQLDTGVKVKSVRGKNRIEIEFIDENDLQRIFDAITGVAEDSTNESSTNGGSADSSANNSANTGSVNSSELNGDTATSNALLDSKLAPESENQ
jgi:ParB family chromosome partitioning protein